MKIQYTHKLKSAFAREIKNEYAKAIKEQWTSQQTYNNVASIKNRLKAYDPPKWLIEYIDGYGHGIADFIVKTLITKFVFYKGRWYSMRQGDLDFYENKGIKKEELETKGTETELKWSDSHMEF